MAPKPPKVPIFLPSYWLVDARGRKAQVNAIPALAEFLVHFVWHGDGGPLGVVEVWFGPTGIIAILKLPLAVEGLWLREALDRYRLRVEECGQEEEVEQLHEFVSWKIC